MVKCAVLIPFRRNVRGRHRKQNYRSKRQAGGFEGVPSYGLGGRQQWARPRGGQLLHATRNQESRVCRRGMGCGQTYVSRPQRTFTNDVLCNVRFEILTSLLLKVLIFWNIPRERSAFFSDKQSKDNNLTIYTT